MQCLNEGCTNEARIKFCSNRCKDQYHNWHNPRGKFAHLRNSYHKEELDMDDIHDEEHPFSGEALGQD